ncbi:hypothetical protein SEA_VINCENZO_23 [Mycobacterium phage Vincenzo]|uniref:Tail assembly chaperone n=2 Tax=Coopervirus vincenzo TaxID=1983110 RepID=A0A0F6WDQ7_9CAUD|nr:hypothetical protein SEA_VINCENZO_23 [Mycobacterium phage Vincenzo]AKF14285.1 hypothetical protein SEA_VINCENZO_23 [Mycobacterium phage Vincenzo]AKF14688.1 hypothetical protein SEA_ALANGRANT_23 [Mycobacterium phage AlanGrant]
MAKVTIEGSITPSTFLARGARVTVQRTERVERLIKAGFVVEVPDARTDTEREADDQAQAARDELGVPARNASRDDWAEFLASHPTGGFVTEGKNRDQLIAEWDAYDAPADAEE